jgi:hypothetical protein
MLIILKVCFLPFFASFLFTLYTLCVICVVKHSVWCDVFADERTWFLVARGITYTFVVSVINHVDRTGTSFFDSFKCILWNCAWLWHIFSLMLFRMANSSQCVYYHHYFLLYISIKCLHLITLCWLPMAKSNEWLLLSSCGCGTGAFVSPMEIIECNQT